MSHDNSFAFLENDTAQALLGTAADDVAGPGFIDGALSLAPQAPKLVGESLRKLSIGNKLTDAISSGEQESQSSPPPRGSEFAQLIQRNEQATGAAQQIPTGELLNALTEASLSNNKELFNVLKSIISKREDQFTAGNTGPVAPPAEPQVDGFGPFGEINRRVFQGVPPVPPR